MPTFEQEYKRKQADRAMASKLSPSERMRLNAQREQEALGAGSSPVSRGPNALQQFLSPAADFSEELVVGAADAMDRIPGAKNETLQNLIRIGAALPGELARSLPNPLSVVAQFGADQGRQLADSAEGFINSRPPVAPPAPPSSGSAVPYVPQGITPEGRSAGPKVDWAGDVRGGASTTGGPRNALESSDLGKRFGLRMGAGGDDVSARQNFLANGTDAGAGMMDYGPQNVGGDNWVNALNANLDDDYAQRQNAQMVARADQDEMSRQSQIVNAMKQEAAQQKTMIEAQQAAQMAQFFRETGMIGSPQVMAEIAKITQREQVGNDLQQGLEQIQMRAQQQLQQLLRPGVDQNDPAIQKLIGDIARKAKEEERSLLLISGARSGNNKVDASKLMAEEPQGY